MGAAGCGLGVTDATNAAAGDAGTDLTETNPGEGSGTWSYIGGDWYVRLDSIQMTFIDVCAHISTAPMT